MLQSIELFSGSGHISDYLKNQGFKTLKIDFNPKLNPDLCIDICNLSSDQLPGSVAILWASPDCARFSRATAQRHWSKKTTKYRIYEYEPVTPEAIKSLGMLQKTIDLINELKPTVWFIENPIGRIHHMPAMRSIGHYRYAVNYLDWGFPYSKETFIFTNILLPLPISISKRLQPGLRSVKLKKDRSLIPPALFQFLINRAIEKVRL